MQICQESRNSDSLWRKYSVEMADLQLWKMKSLTLGLCVCERDRDLFKVKSYFLRLQLSQNFIFALSGLALSEFRLSSMIKPGEVQLFLTWTALPWWKSSSKPPAETLGQRTPEQEQREDLSRSPQHPHDQYFWPLINCKSWNQAGERIRFEGLVFTGRELEGTLYFCSLTSVIFKNYVTVIQRARL